MAFAWQMPTQLGVDVNLKTHTSHFVLRQTRDVGLGKNP